MESIVARPWNQRRKKTTPIGECDTIDLLNHCCAETMYADMCSYMLIPYYMMSPRPRG